MRSRYGISVDDIGDLVSWDEADALTHSALEDTATPLAAAFNGWAYPASMPQLLQMAMSAPSRKAFESMAPWTLGRDQKRRREQEISDDDRKKALAHLEASVVFH